jgi:predicted DNA-binding WGR domain protein
MVTPTLPGEWPLLREWGSSGLPGTVRSRTFACEEEARRAERAGIRRRERHGYQPAQEVAARWAELMAAGGSIHAPHGGAKIKSKTRDCLEKAGQGVFDF